MTAGKYDCDECGGPIVETAAGRECGDCHKRFPPHRPDGGIRAAGGERVEKVGQYHWRVENTDYILTDLPSDPCHKCGDEIPESSYCYFRDGEKANGSMDHICWDCGHKVTGFGTHGSDGQPFTDGGRTLDTGRDFTKEQIE